MTDLSATDLSAPDLSARADIARIFGEQGRRQAEVRARTAAQRIEILGGLHAAIRERLPAITDALAQDFGKPAFEAAGEAIAVLGEIDMAVANLEQWMAPVEVTPSGHAAPGATARILRQPKGRVLIFGPWNFPFALLFQPLVGAIAAGNTCILKPSELTPATSALAAELVKDLYDEAEIALFQGGSETANALLDLPFDHVFFTGSTKIGKLVMAAAARHLSSVTLELGGKCPAIIDETVDMAKAAARIAWGKCTNAGQICLSPDHVWVRAAQQDAFVGAIIDSIRAGYFSEQSLNPADLSGIVDDRNLRRLTGLLEDAVGRGAKIVFGGGLAPGRRIEPTVLIDVPRDAAIMQEEIFGPILPVLTYTDLDDVIDEVNRRDKPLGLYVFSERPEVVDTILSRTSSGGVTVNDVIQHAVEPNLPFGGVGPSGSGSYHGFHSFLAFSHERSVYVQAHENPMEVFLRAPYAGKVEAITAAYSSP